jgi:hypothetical protein
VIDRIHRMPRFATARGLKRGSWLERGDPYVEAFGIIGFVFALIALGTASSATAQIAALKKEVETLKAAQQDRSR